MVAFKTGLLHNLQSEEHPNTILKVTQSNKQHLPLIVQMELIIQSSICMERQSLDSPRSS